MNINDIALRRLGTRSRTIKEMEKYLLEKGFAEGEVRDLIAEFTSYGYLNDARYCEEYFNYAFQKGKGKRRVFNELRQKGIDPTVVNIAFDEYDVEIDERAMARKEAMKILVLADISEEEKIPEKVLGRIARKLAAYGYGADIIYGVIGELRR